MILQRLQFILFCIQKMILYQIVARISYKISFWTQNRMNWKLCRIMRRDLGFIVAAHRFLYREKLFNFDKIEHWILIVRRYWWETSPVVGYFVVGRSELLLLGTNFKEWFFRVASCCFHTVVTDSYRLYLGNHTFFSQSQNDFHRWEVFFRGLGASFNTILFSSHLFRVISPDNLSPYQVTLFHFSDFLRHAVWWC